MLNSKINTARLFIMKINLIVSSILGISIMGGLLYKQHSASLAPSPVNIVKATNGSQFTPKKITNIIANRQWQTVGENTHPIQSLPDEVQVAHIKTQSNAFDQLQKGEKITLYIPQENQSYIGTVEKNHSQFGGQVQVSTGSIENGQAFSSFTVTKGPELTLVMVATGEKVFQIEIDNKTGAGTVINDQSLDFFRKHDDGQVTPPEGIS